MSSCIGTFSVSGRPEREMVGCVDLGESEAPVVGVNKPAHLPKLLKHVLITGDYDRVLPGREGIQDRKNNDRLVMVAVGRNLALITADCEPLRAFPEPLANQVV